MQRTRKRHSATLLGGRRLTAQADAAAEVLGGEFVSGPARLSGSSPRVELMEIKSERFDPKQCLYTSRDRVVCLARDLFENRDVVLKVERKARPDTDRPTGCLEREAAIGRLLPEHPNILGIYDLHYQPGVDGKPLALLAMEYADGGSLRHWLKQQVPDHEQSPVIALDHFLSFCLGVSALHESGILHLDLKPENALFCAGVLKVADFGAARAVVTAQSDDGADFDPPLHAGTPTHMSPEQFSAASIEELTEAADVYALTVVLYEIMNPAHRPPFMGSYRHLRHQHERAAVPTLRGLSLEVAEIINRGLAKDPRERFESVDEMIDALQEVQGVGGLSGTGARLDEQESDVHPAAAEKVAETTTRNETAITLYHEAGKLVDQGDLEESLMLAARACELCPDHPQAEIVAIRLGARANAYCEWIDACLEELKAGRFDAALSFAEQAVAANPKSRTARRLAARISGAVDHIENLRGELLSAIRAHDSVRAQNAAMELDALGIVPSPELLSQGGLR